MSGFSRTILAIVLLLAPSARAAVDIGGLASGVNIGWSSSSDLDDNGGDGLRLETDAGTDLLTIASNGNTFLAPTAQFGWTGRAQITSASDSTITFAASGGGTLATLNSSGAFAPVSISATGDVASGAILSGKRTTLATGTITTSAPAIDISQTWNAGGVTFTGAKINVTDTASAAASLFLDCQTGGTSQVRISKTGIEFGPSGEGLKIYRSSSYYINIGWNGSDVLQINSSGTPCLGGSNALLCLGQNGDAIIRRDAANVIAQRNTTSAQKFLVSKTYTSSTNYEQLEVDATGNAFKISAQKGSGGGTQRLLAIGNVTTGITASTTQTQGQGAITTEIAVVATVANANDTVTLPSAEPGVPCFVVNNGANTLKIFPASGDDLGAGVNTSTTLAAGSNRKFVAIDTTNWETE